MAQLVEHHLAKVRVAGSSPVFRSILCPAFLAGPHGRAQVVFNPMGYDPLLAFLPLGIALVGFLIGLYWIHRIIHDIEDN